MNFYQQLADRIKKGSDSHNLIMEELGDLISDKPSDFIQVLRSSGITVDDNATLAELVDKFVDNAPKNSDLLVSTSLFIADNNKQTNADGESEVSDTGVKAMYKVMHSNFINEPKSGFVVDAIAGAVKAGANVANTVIEGRNQKKYGAQIALDKQQQARSTLLQSIVDKKAKEAQNAQKKLDQEQKTLRVAMMVGGGVLAVGLGIFVYFRFIKKK